MEFSNSDSNIDKFKMFRSSHSVFCKKDVLKSFAKSRENSCARASFLIKLQPEAVFREIFKKTFFLWNTSDGCFWMYEEVTIFEYIQL